MEMLHWYALRQEHPMTRLLAEAVIKRTTAQGSARAILITLAGFADERREIALGLSEIAAIIDRHHDTARRAVRALRVTGDLELLRRGGGKRPNTYRISARYAQRPDPGAA
jgi:hypothetical protein